MPRGGSKLARKRKQRKEERPERKPKKRYCAFCRDRTPIDYKDVQLLRRFISDRGKIRARRVSGNCAQHQRDIAVAVKSAREMALLPYSGR